MEPTAGKEDKKNNAQGKTFHTETAGGVFLLVM